MNCTMDECVPNRFAKNALRSSFRTIAPGWSTGQETWDVPKVTMRYIDWLLPSFRLQWLTPNSTGYSSRHVLLFRLDSLRLTETVRTALRNDRRIKMDLKRVFGSFVVFTQNISWQMKVNVQYVDSLEESLKHVFDESSPSWQLFIQSEKQLALLVCDSALFATFALASDIIKSADTLRTPTVRLATERPSRPFSLHTFQMNRIVLSCIQLNCTVTLETILMTLLALGLNQEQCLNTLICRRRVLNFEEMPKDTVACLKYCSRRPQINKTIENRRVARMLVLDGSARQDLRWHFSKPSDEIELGIDVVDLIDECVVTLSSTTMTQSDLQRLEDVFTAKLIDLSMSLRLSWTDDLDFDEKLSHQLSTFCNVLGNEGHF